MGNGLTFFFFFPHHHKAMEATRRGWTRTYQLLDFPNSTYWELRRPIGEVRWISLLRSPPSKETWSWDFRVAKGACEYADVLENVTATARGLEKKNVFVLFFWWSMWLGKEGGRLYRRIQDALPSPCLYQRFWKRAYQRLLCYSSGLKRNQIRSFPSPVFEVLLDMDCLV